MPQKSRIVPKIKPLSVVLGGIWVYLAISGGELRILLLGATWERISTIVSLSVTVPLPVSSTTREVGERMVIMTRLSESRWFRFGPSINTQFTVF